MPSKEEFEEMKIVEEEEENMRHSDEELETEYEYEYIEEEYPEGTDMTEILKDCKKGDIVMP